MVVTQEQRERMAKNRELALQRLFSKSYVVSKNKTNEHVIKEKAVLISLQNETPCIKEQQPIVFDSLSPSSSRDAHKNQNFDYLVVIDFEATCDLNTDMNPQEIIEFPAVLINVEELAIEDTFQTYVKPQYHPILTAFCTKLTGITQTQVDAGVDLREALSMHDKWLDAKGVKQKIFAILTWTDWDCKVMLESECKVKSLKKPTYFNRWINLKVPFERTFKGLKCNLKSAVETSGLKWEGRPHCGLDDAINTANLCLNLMRRGVVLDITNYFRIYAADGSLISLPKLKKPHDTDNVSRVGSFSSSSNVGGFLASPPDRLCFCGAQSRKRIVKKPGLTQGKPFYACGNWSITGGGQCLFFEWAYEELPSISKED